MRLSSFLVNAARAVEMCECAGVSQSQEGTRLAVQLSVNFGLRQHAQPSKGDHHHGDMRLADATCSRASHRPPGADWKGGEERRLMAGAHQDVVPSWGGGHAYPRFISQQKIFKKSTF